jgi:hypothetical protein
MVLQAISLPPHLPGGGSEVKRQPGTGLPCYARQA